MLQLGSVQGPQAQRDMDKGQAKCQGLLASGSLGRLTPQARADVTQVPRWGGTTLPSPQSPPELQVVKKVEGARRLAWTVSGGQAVGAWERVIPRARGRGGMTPQTPEGAQVGTHTCVGQLRTACTLACMHLCALLNMHGGTSQAGPAGHTQGPGQMVSLLGGGKKGGAACNWARGREGAHCP